MTTAKLGFVHELAGFGPTRCFSSRSGRSRRVDFRFIKRTTVSAVRDERRRCVVQDLAGANSCAASTRGRKSVAAAGAVRGAHRSVRALAAISAQAIMIRRSRTRKLWIVACVSFAVMIFMLSGVSGPALASGAGIAISAKLTKTSILSFFGLFSVAAALAAAETAITTLWPWKVRQLASEEGDASMFAVLESNLTRFLTTILIATTVSTIFTTALATELAAVVFSAKAAVAYVTSGLTFFFLFFGEVLPKSLAVQNPERVLRVLLPFVYGLSLVLYPVGKLLAFMSKLILKLLNLHNEGDAPISEQELRMIIAGAYRSGSIEPYESKLISNVLDLEEIDVRDVMCPRVDMVSLPNTATLRDFLEDTIDNIVGVIYAKSLLRYLGSPEKLDTTKVEELVDVPYFVPESLSAWNVLEQMRMRRLHMAIVVDEYGGTAGIVTLEDILEEVVGEIYDEDDDYEAESTEVVARADGSFSIDGQAELEKVTQALSMNIDEDDLDQHGTISGFLCDRMEGIPSTGDTVTIDNVEFQVVEADDRRITTLLASPAQTVETMDSEDSTNSIVTSSSDHQ